MLYSVSCLTLRISLWLLITTHQLLGYSNNRGSLFSEGSHSCSEKPRKADMSFHRALFTHLGEVIKQLFMVSEALAKHPKEVQWQDLWHHVVYAMVQSGAEEKPGRCTGTNRTPLSSSLSPSPPIQNASKSTVRAENRPACQSPSMEQHVPRSKERNNIHVIQKSRLNPCPQQRYC